MFGSQKAMKRRRTELMLLAEEIHRHAGTVMVVKKSCTPLVKIEYSQFGSSLECDCYSQCTIHVQIDPGLLLNH